LRADSASNIPNDIAPQGFSPCLHKKATTKGRDAIVARVSIRKTVNGVNLTVRGNCAYNQKTVRAKFAENFTTQRATSGNRAISLQSGRLCPTAQTKWAQYQLTYLSPSAKA
jgi:hypothetical protein